MDFDIPEDLKMVQTLSRDFVREQLIPLEKEILGRESDMEGASRHLTAERRAELVKLAKEIGLWGVGIPDELGGAGLGTLGASLVEEEMAKTIIPFDLGDVTPILFESSAAQKETYLLPAISGSKTCCLALIEPGTFDFPAEMGATARKTGGGYILNGQKVVVNPPQSFDFAIVFAVTDPEKSPRERVTAFLVDAGTKGLSVETGGVKTGWRAQVAQPIKLKFDECQVDASHLLGSEGHAFELGKRWLPSRRVVRGARCVGAATRLLDKSVEHAKSWTIFGRTISGWPAVQSSLAEIEIDIQAARGLVYQSAWLADNGRPAAIQSAMVKVFSTEMLKRVADRAVLIKSGPGPLKGLPLEYLCRSLLLQNIADKALELQKYMVAKSILESGTIL